MIKRKSPFERELEKLEKQERAFLDKYSEETDSRINRLLKEKVPDKLQNTLDNAFAKAFSLIFQKGTGIIEKTYQKEKMEQKDIDDEINHFIDTEAFADKKEMDLCIAETSSCLSKELLYMKFLQGIPLVGAVGGAFDAIYMKRINRYVELKYRRRFLYNKRKRNCLEQAESLADEAVRT